ncbi:VPA1269 family protein [Rheinheimera sp.]|uniref:gamma-mobile-trio integrase GmtZ n=1 Tax=Rheinheimera sp. TaxID=1869214 RepID=UPI0037C75BE4
MSKFIYATFIEARRLVKEMGIMSQRQYRVRYKESSSLPFKPEVTYKDNWVSWSDFLPNPPSKFLNYSDARSCVHQLGITTYKQYQMRYKECPGLPSAPKSIYKVEWTSWEGFLAKACSSFLSFNEAKAIVKELGITSYDEYYSRYKERHGLPSHPKKIYKTDWVSWNEFLQREPKTFLSYNEAKSTLKKLGITSYKEYMACKNDYQNLPASPHKIYRKEWISWGEFLNKPRRKFCSYAEAKKIIQQLGIASSNQYRNRYKENSSLPSNPNLEYQTEWLGWADFLVERLPKFKSYEEAKQIVNQMGISSYKEYMSRFNKVCGLPSDPRQTYKKDWAGWFDFLNKQATAFLSYEEAQIIVQNLGISSSKEYSKKYKAISGLPSVPSSIYKGKWLGWKSFFGLPSNLYLNFDQAKDWVKEQKITTRDKYYASRILACGLPFNPKKLYKEEWTSWREFLYKPTITYLDYNDAKKEVIELGIGSITEYRARFSESKGLHANPDRYYTEDWLGWSDFLPAKYISYNEAKRLVQELGIFSSSEYASIYKNILGLPSDPKRVYKNDWVSWSDFLPELSSPYLSYLDAKTNVERMAIFSSKDYRARYKECPGLPYNPQRIYNDDWSGWHHFLPKVTPSFASFTHAKKLVQQFGISSHREYKAHYKEIRNLPAKPYDFYKEEWAGWPEFLMPASIKSISSLKLACRILDIKDSRQYRHSRKEIKQLPSHPERLEGWIDYYDLLDIPRPYPIELLKKMVLEAKIKSLAEYSRWRIDANDPKLPARPIEVYDGKGWTNTYDFFSQPRPYKVRYLDNDWMVWGELIKEFLKTARGGDTKEKDLCEFVREFIQPYGFEKDPLQFLIRSKTNIQPMLDLLSKVSVARKKKWLFSINEFFDWIIKSTLTVEDEETGEVHRVNGAKDPFEHINFDGESTTPVVNETNKLSLPYQFVKAGRDWIFPPNSIEEKINFCDLNHLQNFSADWILIDEKFEVDFNDPDCVTKEVNGKRFLWFPAFWIYTYALMHLPARGRQIIYCDSGEADIELADFCDGKVVWIENKSEMAGLTKSQSMIYKTPDNDIGVRYTSNKTNFNGEGYTIPFMPLELAYWLIKLRKWQQKYNRITRPMPWIECTRTKLNEIQKKQKGCNCFLFRDFDEEEPGTFSNRLSLRLAACLFFSAGEELSLATYNKLTFSQFQSLNINEPSLSNFQSDFTPHSMRVSLINAYINEFGLPIEIILKLVGHSSIVMTIYYMKSGPGGLHVREKLRRGEKQAAASAVGTLRQFIEQQRVEECHGELVANNEDFLKFLSNDRPVAAYQWKDYGICPVGGNFCKEGGEPVAGKSTIYHPVPAGYLGEQNCLQCRFFVTGPAFMVGLVSLFNEISHNVSTQYRRFNHLQYQVQELTEKIEVISHKQYREKLVGEQYSQLVTEKSALQEKRRLINSELETRSKKIDPLIIDMNAIHRLVRACRLVIEKMNLSAKNAYQLIVSADISLETSLEENSWFYQLTEVCENAELFQSCSDDLALAPRSQAIDRLLQFNDMKPQMMFLTEEEQLIVGNQLTQLLLTRLKSWDKLDRLMDNELTFKDLPAEERLTTIDLKQLFSSAETLKIRGA